MQNSLLTDNQIREWATLLAREVDNAYDVPEKTIESNYGEFVAIVQCSADIIVDDDKNCGLAWWSENEKCEIKELLAENDYTTEELEMLSSRLQEMLN